MIATRDRGLVPKKRSGRLRCIPSNTHAYLSAYLGCTETKREALFSGLLSSSQPHSIPTLRIHTHIAHTHTPFSHTPTPAQPPTTAALLTSSPGFPSLPPSFHHSAFSHSYIRRRYPLARALATLLSSCRSLPVPALIRFAGAPPFTHPIHSPSSCLPSAHHLRTSQVSAACIDSYRLPRSTALDSTPKPQNKDKRQATGALCSSARIA